MKWSYLSEQLNYKKQFIKTQEDVFVTGIETDSRNVQSGYVFVCLKGEHTDGHRYIEQAIENGASVIVTEEDTQPIDGVVMLYTQSTVRSLAEISNAYYGSPSEKMKVIGVTGTNGKTSITQFLNQLYRQKGMKTGVIGTIHTDINGRVTPSENTTPFAHDLQHTLYDMKNEGVTHVFMEVSSHALSMGRVNGCDFAQGVFTNLSQDHLDYHKTMEDYKQAKGLLFSRLGNGFHKTAVLNADDETYDYLCGVTGGKVLSYGIERDADIRATSIQTERGLAFGVTYQGKTRFLQTSLVGRFHVCNLLAVIAVCLSDGWSIDDTLSRIERLSPVKGRMEKVDIPQDFTVIVDYAHTPDALENALKSISKKRDAKLYTIVGCGGNRDKTKRPLMAHVAETYSDVVFLTSDNPRFEEPKEILSDMEAGMEGNAYHVIEDRKEAIQTALACMEDGDVLLIAGKGHEEYQIIGDKKVPFSDSLIVKETIQKRKNGKETSSH